MSVESINTNVASTVQPNASTVNTVDRAERVGRNDAAKVESLAEAGSNEQIDRKELDGAVEKLNNFVSSSAQRNLSFSIDEDTKDMVVTVRDTQTQEVIRQMPTKEALAVAKQIESMLGLILNDTA